MKYALLTCATRHVQNIYADWWLLMRTQIGVITPREKCDIEIELDALPECAMKTHRAAECL